MAVGRGISQLLKKRLQFQSFVPSFSFITKQEEVIESAAMKPLTLCFLGGKENFFLPRKQTLRVLALLGVGISGALSFASLASADESGRGLPAPSYPWPHKGILSSRDNASCDMSSIRRGQKVFQQVCSSCHSMSLISFRDLVGVAYSEEETKSMATEIEVVDGPNDEGEISTRPGKAQRNGQNFVFALLAGYHDPPAGVSIREGLHCNAYFPGGAIAIPKMLVDGAVDHEDGTPATESQMGKDAAAFLSWAAEPEMEERKLMGLKWIFVISLALLQAAYYRRLKLSVIKSRKLVLDVVH